MVTTTSLYQELKDVKWLKEFVEEETKIFRGHLASRSMAHDVPIDVTVSEVDVPALQRDLFRPYENNRFLRMAMSGTQSLEESVRELAKRFRGLKRFIPHRKDPEHNQRIEELGELIPTYELETNGVFRFDNALNIGLFTGIGVFSVATGFVMLMPDFNMSEAGEISAGATILMGLGMSDIKGSYIRDSLKAAHYIDSKIMELGLYKK